MSRAYKCDRCGALYESYEGEYCVTYKFCQLRDEVKEA